MSSLRFRFHYLFFIILISFSFAESAFNPVVYFKKGGPAMWPLLAASVIVIAFTIERVIVLFMVKRKLKPKQFAEFMEKKLKENPDNKEAAVDEMIEFCDKKGGPVANLLLEGLKKFKECKKAGLGMMESKQWMNTAIEERGRIEIPVLEARLPVISTIANVSPLMGLLGTVIGMIGAFETMAQSAGGAKPDELSGNISVALLTTAGGLIVAIPSLLIYNYLKSHIEGYILEMEEVSLLMVDSIVEKK